LVDIAKIIYHSFQNEFHPPRRSNFFGPLGVLKSLELLLGHPEKLRAHVIKQWNLSCAKTNIFNWEHPIGR
jgi:hypothetical protein